jgi:hypothetical protein
LNKTNEDKQGQNRTSRTKGKEKKTRENGRRGLRRGRGRRKKCALREHRPLQKENKTS